MVLEISLSATIPFRPLNTLSIYKWDYFYTITDPSICYDELVIKLNEMFNKFCPISRKKKK